MAKTSLRAYDREIESLIEQNQFEQAIAHARHILKFYPKHLQTYRLLGKAYLESQRYGDAADVFQRVLSAIPDDFVAHVGMSIIREDEGNLDDAIWHMERAFEIQPANSAIQGELRRLYGRRDGLEPPKVRLTRGALARMYLKGELYQQAIGELRAALAEDPQRPDLLAMLAQAYFLTGQRVEAADTCSTLIKKTPYCLEANRILADVLANSERASESQIYRQRVTALEPYAAHISPAAPTAEKVPDSAISLEKLVWSPGQPVTGLPNQPEWASSLGVDLGSPPPPKETIPDWLSGHTQRSAFTPTPEAEGTPPFLSEETPPVFTDAPRSEGSIPGWMKEAGWGPAAQAEEEHPILFEDEGFAMPSQEGVTPGDIPDWVQAMAPAGEPAAEDLPVLSKPDESDALSWLQEAPPGPTDSVVTWLEDRQPPPAETAALGAPPSAASEIPDWLKELGEPEPATPPVELPTPFHPEAPKMAEEPSVEGSGEPDWLATGDAVPLGSASDVPDWLKVVESEAGSEPLDWLGETAREEWLPEEGGQHEKEQAIPSKDLASGLDDDAAFAWLEGLAAKQGAEEALLLSPDERREQPPDWVSKAASSAEAPPMPEPRIPAGLPDWLQKPETEEPSAWIPETGAPEIPAGEAPLPEDWKIEEPTLIDRGAPSAEAGVIPEWLSEMGPPPIPIEEELPAVPPSFVAEEAEEVTAAELPDWLSMAKAEAVEEPFELEAELPAGPPSFVAEEAEEVTAAELPDWLSMAKAETVEVPFELEAELPAGPPSFMAEEAEEIAAAELPDWLTQVKPETVEELFELEAELPAGPPSFMAEEAEEVAAAELPDWLSMAKAEAEPLEAVQAGTGPEWLSEVAIPVEDQPALPPWMEGLEVPSEEEPALAMLFSPQERPAVPAEEAPPPELVSSTITDTQPTRIRQAGETLPHEALEVEKPEITPAAEAVPDWLKGLEVEEPALEYPLEPEVEAPQAAMDDEAAFAWLEGLAARMGAEEALLLKPEDRTEQQPEWIQKAAEEELAADLTPAMKTVVPEEAEITAPELPLSEGIPVEEVAEEAPVLQAEEELMIEETVPEELVVEVEAERPVEVPFIEELTHVPEAVEEAPLEPVAEVTEAAAVAMEAETLIEIPSLAEVTRVPEAVEEAPLEPVAEVPEEAVPELPSWLRDTGFFEPLEAEAAWEPPVEAAPEEEAVPQAAEEAPVSQPFELVEEAFARIDLNEAGLADLEHTPGVGFTRAQAVITYRQAFGAFSSLDELVNISGFDAQLVESLKSRLSVGEALPVEAISEAIDIHQLTLIQARNALIQSDTSKALSHYAGLIQARQVLPEVIQDLNEALYRFPVDIHIWEALGDAHMRAGHLQEALNAYTKAEELIR